VSLLVHMRSLGGRRGLAGRGEVAIRVDGGPRVGEGVRARVGWLSRHTLDVG
jgi:hypothetical protein